LAVLVVYTVLALAYSAGLKRALALDVIVIALLYELRVIAVTRQPRYSYLAWLLVFVVFVVVLQENLLPWINKKFPQLSSRISLARCQTIGELVGCPAGNWPTRSIKSSPRWSFWTV
jgi:hypothetical protein